MPTRSTLVLAAGQVGVAVAGMSLVYGPATLADAQTRCVRDGDWLVCEDGGRYPIRTDPFARPRPGSRRGERVGSDVIGPETGMTDPARLRTSDGLECWRHGDHAHCE
jgi:hypothetical protein